MNSSARSKATLFCSVCGHESPPDGDWDESATTTRGGERLALSCPDCETTITRRPVGARGADAVMARD